ncbi:BON domain-containing protein [Legionella shakespearei]|uniref:Phospholipid binding protein n=1 Tax=Legionella shakespearei DSM 23087 TaxID=1122169 RepID=A0A0W0Z1J6_9GAMM|nr:BON domain-containing protein [Legionella shakespearei]KTD62691.1 phospholipid binding protein [Legionella shakespearei DSM 23087]
MQKKSIQSIVVGMLFLLTGCMNNSVGTPSLFSPAPAGMTLTQSVQDALAGQDDPVLARVHVTTNQNTVILSGYVKKIRQSDTAEQIARQVPGVQNVVNNLIVRQ